MSECKTTIQCCSDVGRAEYLIARALHVAATALESDRYPTLSDAGEIRELLRTNFENYQRTFQNIELFQRAVGLGYVPESTEGIEGAAKYLAANKHRADDFDLDADIPF